MLIGDDRRFKQVLINLVKNAVKFTNHGQISIRYWYNYDKEKLHVEVQDTGVGIAADDIPKLFNKFGVLARTAGVNHEGIGLGLTIVRQIVQQAKGKVSVRSDGLGKGSVFSFSMKMPVC